MMKSTQIDMLRAENKQLKEEVNTHRGSNMPKSTTTYYRIERARYTRTEPTWETYVPFDKPPQSEEEFSLMQADDRAFPLNYMYRLVRITEEVVI